MPESSTFPAGDLTPRNAVEKCNGHLSHSRSSSLEDQEVLPTTANDEGTKEDTHSLKNKNVSFPALRINTHHDTADKSQGMHTGPLSENGEAGVGNRAHDERFSRSEGCGAGLGHIGLSEPGDVRKHLSSRTDDATSPVSVQALGKDSSSMAPPSHVSASGKPSNAASLSSGALLMDYNGTIRSSPLRTSSKFDANATKSEVPISADEKDARSEIRSIIDQFEYSSESQEAAISTGSIHKTSLTSSFERPPRNSSLEHLQPVTTTSRSDHSSSQSSRAQPYLHNTIKEKGTPNHNDDPVHSQLCNLSFSGENTLDRVDGPKSPKSSISMHKSLPPAPDPEPDLPFDFHRFLEQLRHRTAGPVAKFLRSFLMEFGKKQWMVHEQIKIINDFLTFITTKMAQCDIWREVSEAEFDNAKEGMEKLVMNRLYTQTFSPAIPPTLPVSPAKGKKTPVEKSLGLGRRGQHQEDIERDDILAQKVRIYGWVQEEHLDIPPVDSGGKRFLSLAQQGKLLFYEVQVVLQIDGSLELLKIKSYRAPRDKVICILNCCKVIFGTLYQVDTHVVGTDMSGFLRNAKTADTSADSFVPLLIYVVLQANPEHLVSNVQYIMRFRNQDKLGGEAGYYLSSLVRQPSEHVSLVYVYAYRVTDGRDSVHREYGSDCADCIR